jgi:hypothetical protein
MSAESWLAGNASLKAAHEKYGAEFVAAERQFRDGPTDAERIALWNDYENRGENIVAWYRARSC